MYRQSRGDLMAAPSYQKLIEDLGYKTLPERAENLYTSWIQTDMLWHMSKDDLVWICKVLELNEIIQNTLIKAYKTIQQNEKLLSILSFLQYLIIIGAHPSDWLIKEAPHITHEDISESVFQLLTILSLIPVAKEDHIRRHISEEHMMFNLNHLKGYINPYYLKHQAVGIDNFGWTTYLASLGLIHLSSLHFMHHVYTDRFLFFRNHKTKEVIALAEKGISVREDGQFNGVNEYYNQKFITTFDEDDVSYKGYRMNPMGSISSRLVELQKNEYELILKSGDYVIDFHIPTKSDYTIDGFRQSLNQAKDFFKSHYPEYTYPAFWCVSWLYSPQITALIDKPSSNIIHIAKQGYRLPATPDAKSLYSFVFGTSEPDLSKIEAKTSLERSVIHHITSGYTINAGCFIYFFDDLNCFGETPYLKQLDIDIHQQLINKKRG
jgi:hypothetical protein